MRYLITYRNLSFPEEVGYAQATMNIIEREDKFRISTSELQLKLEVDKPISDDTLQKLCEYKKIRSIERTSD